MVWSNAPELAPGMFTRTSGVYNELTNENREFHPGCAAVRRAHCRPASLLGWSRCENVFRARHDVRKRGGCRMAVCRKLARDCRILPHSLRRMDRRGITAVRVFALVCTRDLPRLFRRNRGVTCRQGRPRPLSRSKLTHASRPLRRGAPLTFGGEICAAA